MQFDFFSRRVLVADDEPLQLRAVAETIRQRFGCEVVTCQDGEEAVRCLLDTPFDVFVTDMVMPGLFGLDLIRRAKEIQSDCDIIVMTGFLREFPYVAVVREGACDFIGKPHSAEEMSAKLFRAFRERELREELERESSRLRESFEALQRMRSAQTFTEKKYVMLFECSVTPMVVLRPDSSIIDDVNRAFCELTGRRRESLIDNSMWELLAESDRERFEVGLDAFDEVGRGALADIRLNHSEGDLIFLDLNVSYVRDDYESLVFLSCKDVTEQHIMREKLMEMASTDELTGLFNQRSFHARLQGAIDSARTRHENLTLVFIDLDNFKSCNDTHGHQVGDELLQYVGHTVRSQIRYGDEGFRYGGDEFALLLKSADDKAGLATARRLQAAFALGECRGTSMSCGVAQLKDDMDARILLQKADGAVYQAKAQGKNTICVA